MAHSQRLRIVTALAQGDKALPLPLSVVDPLVAFRRVASIYGARPVGDITVPTGFDPMKVAVFEAMVESAYLLATAHGPLGAEQMDEFEAVVHAACGADVPRKEVRQLIEDVKELGAKSGLDGRLETLGGLAAREAQGKEVLNVAVLLALADEPLSDTQKALLDRLATALRLKDGDVEKALSNLRSLVEALTKAKEAGSS